MQNPQVAVDLFLNVVVTAKLSPTIPTESYSGFGHCRSPFEIVSVIIGQKSLPPRT